jgi:hypothetical protein
VSHYLLIPYLLISFFSLSFFPRCGYLHGGLAVWAMGVIAGLQDQCPSTLHAGSKVAVGASGVWLVIYRITVPQPSIWVHGGFEGSLVGCVRSDHHSYMSGVTPPSLLVYGGLWVLGGFEGSLGGYVRSDHYSYMSGVAPPSDYLLFPVFFTIVTFCSLVVDW